MSKTYLNNDAIIDKSITDEKLSESIRAKLDKADSILGLTSDEVNQLWFKNYKIILSIFI